MLEKFLRKSIPCTLLFVLMFYYIYPQGLEVFNSSFLIIMGVVGLGVFFYNQTVFPEMIKVLFAIIPLLLFCLLTAYVNRYDDGYLLQTIKSNLGYFFSAYLIALIFFKIHPDGGIKLFFYYFIGVVTLQGIISIAMYFDPAVDKFFTDLMMMSDLAILKRNETRGERLLGYGIAFFGVGILCGIGLMVIIYILVAERTSKLERILLAILYSFIFYYGLLSARTTMIGGAASVVLLVVLMMTSKSRKLNLGQLTLFLGIIISILVIGYTLCYMYFDEFADWAFEAFINYNETGELRTRSSDGLEDMFILPDTTQLWLIGHGHMAFWGTDVGLSRLLFYFGLPGTLAFFFFQGMLIKLCWTKNMQLNLFLVGTFFFNLVINYKGYSDLNYIYFMIYFYLIYRKYYVFKSKKHLSALQEQVIRNRTLQSKESVGRF